MPVHQASGAKSLKFLQSCLIQFQKFKRLIFLACDFLVLRFFETISEISNTSDILGRSHAAELPSLAIGGVGRALRLENIYAYIQPKA